jgi:Sulfocyanin (SoxE) domain
MPRFASLLAAGVLLIVLPAGAARAGSAGRPPPSHWLSWNAAKRTARLLLVAGYDSTNGGFNFDGYARGRLLFRIPHGWLVTVVCKNAGSRNDSCAVVHGAGTATIAFHGAATPNPGLGLAPGHSATFRFRASRLGVFRLASLVSGHELARQYDVLDIVRSGRPRVETLSQSPG